MNPIHHTRHFHKPQPMRDRWRRSGHDILKLERETEGLLAEIISL